MGNDRLGPSRVGSRVKTRRSVKTRPDHATKRHPPPNNHHKTKCMRSGPARRPSTATAWETACGRAGGRQDNTRGRMISAGAMTRQRWERCQPAIASLRGTREKKARHGCPTQARSQIACRQVAPVYICNGRSRRQPGTVDFRARLMS